MDEQIKALRQEVDKLIEKGNEAILSNIYSKETIDGIKQELSEKIAEHQKLTEEQTKKIDELNAAIGRFQAEKEKPVTNWQKFDKALRDGKAIETYKAHKYWSHDFDDTYWSPTAACALPV